MTWSSDTSLPVDHTAIAAIPGEIRNIKLGLESGAITETNKVLVSPVIQSSFDFAVSSVVRTAALTGVIRIIARTSAPATSSLYVVAPDGTERQFTDGPYVKIMTAFEVPRTAIIGGNISLKNYISTEVASIQVANSAASTILSILLATVSTGNLDQGSVQVAAAAVTDTLRCAAVLAYGKDHATKPGQIILRPCAYSTTPATAAITGIIDVSGARVTNAKDPLEAQDTVTKTYLESKVGVGTASPIPYAGGESSTDPNGNVFKRGYIARTGTTTVVTFNTAFNSVVSCNIISKSSAMEGLNHVVASCTTSILTVLDSLTVAGYYWQVWGT